MLPSNRGEFGQVGPAWRGEQSRPGGLEGEEINCGQHLIHSHGTVTNLYGCGRGCGRGYGSSQDALLKPASHGISLTTPFSCITITPPYEEVMYSDVLHTVSRSPLVSPDTIIVIEYPVEIGSLPHCPEGTGMVGVRNRRYGRTVLGVYIYKPTGKLDGATSRPEEFVLGAGKKGRKGKKRKGDENKA